MKKTSLSILLLVVCIGVCAAINSNYPLSVHGGKDSPEGPYNLVAQQIGDDSVLLVWENPVYENLPFGYHVYCNNEMVWDISGAYVTDYLLENVNPGCHQFFITACFDAGCESLPSNIAEITITSNSDDNLANTGLEMKLYPNPSRSDVQISLSGLKHGEADISVLNVKGQKIRQINLGSSQAGLWDGRDAQGRRVSEGIYYLKATTTQGSVIQKIILVR
jgi:hypothetical protein